MIPALLAACAENPVTHHRELVLVSEAQEIAQGRALHPKVIQHFGRYPDEGLQTYVQGVGERLAAHSHRPQLIYRFTVLDSPETNAFSLPGGYIYVMRGLLAYLNSEAELAAVLGHEIGHVAARHSVRQQTMATAASLGYTLGSVFFPELRTQTAKNIYDILGTAVIRGYGRQMELEADRLAAQYMARVGYDPKAILEVLRTLKALDDFERSLKREEVPVYHGLFATHPDEDTRLKALIAEIPPAAHPLEGRERYLDHIEGLAFGPPAKEGVLRRNHFYHKGLGFAMTFPKGWKVENRPERLSASPPSGDALLQVLLVPRHFRLPPRDFLKKRLGVKAIDRGEAFTHFGLPGYTGIARLSTPFGKRPVRLVVIYFRDKALVFAGAARDEEDPFRYDGAFLAAARSFHPLLDVERPLAEPLRIRVIAAKPGTTFEALAAASPLPDHPAARLRLLNHLYPSGEPAPGQPIKVVR